MTAASQPVCRHKFQLWKEGNTIDTYECTLCGVKIEVRTDDSETVQTINKGKLNAD